MVKISVEHVEVRLRSGTNIPQKVKMRAAGKNVVETPQVIKMIFPAKSVSLKGGNGSVMIRAKNGTRKVFSPNEVIGVTSQKDVDEELKALEQVTPLMYTYI